MIPTENKNTIHFKQWLLPNCFPRDLEIVTENGGESTSQYHIMLVVAKFTGKRKKTKSGYFIATPRTEEFKDSLEVKEQKETTVDKATLSINYEDINKDGENIDIYQSTRETSEEAQNASTEQQPNACDNLPYA
jgi:hypothetical protein